MIKKLNFSKFLTTASAIAVVSASGGAMGAGEHVFPKNDPCNFSTSAHWGDQSGDPIKVGDQDYITFFNDGIKAGSVSTAAIEAYHDGLDDIYIEDITIGTNSLTKITFIKDSQTINFGNIKKEASGSAGSLVFQSGGINDTVRLIGGDRDSRTSSADYSAIDGVDFADAGKLVIDTSHGHAHHTTGILASGSGDAITITGDASNTSGGILNVNTGLNVSGSSWLGLGEITLGTAGQSSELKVTIGADVSVDGDNITFNNADSGLYFADARAINLSNAITGGDVEGSLTIETDGNAAVVNNSSSGSLGTSNSVRLKKLLVQGDSATTIKTPVYAQSIEYGTSTASQSLIFNDKVDGGASSSLKFTDADATQVAFNDDATITTIDFDGNDSTVSIDSATLTAEIKGKSSDASAVAGTLLLEGDAALNGAASSLSMITAGEDSKTASIGGFDHSVTELQLSHADGTVEFADGANIKVDGAGNGGAINSTGGAAGTLTFLGSSTIDGTVGANTAPSEINAEGDANSTVTFSADVSTTTLNFGDGTVKLGANFTGDIKLDNAKQGTLTFTGTGTSTGSVTATGDVIIQASRTFSSASLLMPQITVQESNTDITLTAADLGVIKAYTTETDRSQDLIVNVEQNIGGTIGTSDNPFGNIILNADVAANIKTSNLYAGITTNTDGEGSVVFATDNSSVLNLGDNTNSLKSVKFSENGTASENVYATNITVEDAKTANFGGDITSTELLMDGATATASFSDSATINSTIEADDDDHGVISFAGSASVTGTIGSTKSLATINANGDANSTVTFSNNTSATKLNIGAGTVELDSSVASVTLDSEVNFTSDSSGKILVSGANNTIIAGDVATSSTNRGIVEIDSSVGDNTVAMSGQVGDNSNDNALDLLDIKGASKVNFNGNKNIHINKVNLSTNSSLRLSKSGAVYRFDQINNADGDGSLHVAQNVTLKSNGSTINLGTSDARLNSLEFIGNRALTVEDEINIYAQNLINDALDRGIIEFQGKSTFDISETPTKSISRIDILDNAYVIIKVPGLSLKKSVSIGDNATLELKENIIADEIVSNGTNIGSLIFSNDDSITIDSTIGGDAGGGILDIINFAGSDIDITKKVIHTDGVFKFSADDAMKVSFSEDSGIGDAVFTNETSAEHAIILGNALTSFSKNLSTSDANPLNFQLDDGTNAEIVGGDATGTNFTTGTNGKGELELNNSAMTINKVGASAMHLGKLTFTEDATVKNSTYATEISIANNKTATLYGTIESDKFTFGGSSAQVTFADNASLNSAIAVDVAGGIAKFSGDIKIKNNIGSTEYALSKVQFADDASKKNIIEADIYATDISTNRSSIVLNKDVKFSGNITTNSTTFDLGEHNLSNVQNIDINGTNILNCTLSDQGASTTIQGGGISNTGNITFSSNAVLQMNMQDNEVTRNTGEPRKFTVISGPGAQGVDASQIQLLGNNDVINWVVSIGEDGISLIEKNDTKSYLQSKAGAQDSEDAELLRKLSTEPVDSDGGKITDMLIGFARGGYSAKMNETLERVTDAGRVSTSVASGLTSDIGDALSNRVLTLDAISMGIAGLNIEGVSAGDDCDDDDSFDYAANFGAWVSPFYGKSFQKATNGLTGYSNEYYGGSFGVDTKLTNNTILGAAVTVSNSNIKHNGLKTGDRTRMNSFLFSLYGLFNITDGGFFLGSGTFSRNKVKNHAQRVSSINNYDMANSNYNANSFSLKAMFGYNRATEKAVITPMLGMRYTKVDAINYSESGATVQNLEVSTKPQGKFDVIAGMKAMGVVSCSSKKNGLVLTPEARGFVNYSLTNRSPQQKVKLGSIERVTAAKKADRLKYNLGVGVHTEYQGAEYGAHYDLYLSDKMFGQQGSLKVRVNF